MKTTYEKFEVDSTNVNWDSVANVAGVSSNIGQRGLMSEASNDQNPSFSIAGSADEDVVIGILETKPIDDAIEVGKDAQSNPNPNGIESDTIITQIIPDAHNNG